MTVVSSLNGISSSGGRLGFLAETVTKYLDKKHFREEKCSNRLQAVISEKYRQELEATSHIHRQEQRGNRFMNAYCSVYFPKPIPHIFSSSSFRSYIKSLIHFEFVFAHTCIWAHANHRKIKVNI